MIITDKLKSYNAANTEVMPGVKHRQQKYQNNRAENSARTTVDDNGIGYMGQ